MADEKASKGTPGQHQLELSEGAVALVDALGFRGIWRRAKTDALLSTLHDCRARALDRARRAGSEDLLTVHVGAFSDNVIIAARLKRPLDPRTEPTTAPNVCSTVVGNVVVELQAAALESPVPLAFRGTIARGLIYADDHFVVGEAVDTAATWMEQAEGAIVWVQPDALYGPAASRFHPVFPCKVPLKGRGELSTQAVNPFIDIALGQGGGIKEVDAFAKKLLSTFSSNSPDVELKRQNTARFLHHAKKVALGEWNTPYTFDDNPARDEDHT